MPTFELHGFSLIADANDVNGLVDKIQDAVKDAVYADESVFHPVDGNVVDIRNVPQPFIRVWAGPEFFKIHKADIRSRLKQVGLDVEFAPLDDFIAAKDL